MPLANLEEYLNLLETNQGFSFVQSGGSLIGGRLNLAYFPSAPSAPTVSIALNSTSSYGIPNSLSNPTFLGGRFSYGQNKGITIVLVDLLNISGGLDASVTTPQSTNLPTAPLTRYTDGNGVFAAVICHGVMGLTQVLIEATYINQSGISKITPASIIAGGNQTNTGRLFILPLASGDTGFRSVSSVTLSASTGNSNLFGILLFKPLALFELTDDGQIDAISSGSFVGAFAQALPDACLGLLIIGGAIQNQSLNGTLFLSEV